MNEGDTTAGESRRHHDPAAPHTAPFPHHIPRWLAWLLLVAFAGSGLLCARMAVGGG
ncbi:MAG TPA: hypothetical protein VFY49_01830 [Myxococcota bacterium]|nr:hypothetical protein [Myxococcota bacterium]